MSTLFSTRIAKQLRQARKTDSMAAIARRCGVTRVCLYRVSQGKEDPSVTIAAKIARGLKMRLEIVEK